MIRYEWRNQRENIYRLVVYKDNEILDVFEREDVRDERTARISLFGLSGSYRHLTFDNPEIDKFLFL